MRYLIYLFYGGGRWNRKLTKAFDIYEIFILWRWTRKWKIVYLFYGGGTGSGKLYIYSMEVEPEEENCVTP
jgi:hypothetical protein